jgi:hypothetical protein
MFQLSDEERAKIQKWVDELPPGPTGATGGRLTYLFTPTTIGTVVVVRDNWSKLEIDVTDYESW